MAVATTSLRNASYSAIVKRSTLANAYIATDSGQLYQVRVGAPRLVVDEKSQRQVFSLQESASFGDILLAVALEPHSIDMVMLSCDSDQNVILFVRVFSFISHLE